MQLLPSSLICCTPDNKQSSSFENVAKMCNLVVGPEAELVVEENRDEGAHAELHEVGEGWLEVVAISELEGVPPRDVKCFFSKIPIKKFLVSEFAYQLIRYEIINTVLSATAQWEEIPLNSSVKDKASFGSVRLRVVLLPTI